MCISDDCESGSTGRRSFLAGATATIASVPLWDAFVINAQEKPVTRVLDDPRIQHGLVRFKHGGKETLDGFMARPKTEGTYPAVLVIAGNRISEEYIPNTCAALAIAFEEETELTLAVCIKPRSNDKTSASQSH